jgi:hypothetical protein
VPGRHAASWYLAPGGALTASKPTASGSDTFTWNKRARPATDFTGETRSGGLWGALPAYDWTQNPPGTSVSYVSAPLTANTVVVGGGALYAWVRTRARDLDLQATVTEVRPDGKEAFVQSGWLRASVRKLDRRRSTPLEPVLSLRERDARRLPKGRWAKVAIPLYYQGYAYRAGSRIRVIVSAVGGDQPVWAFAQTRPRRGHPKVSIARAPARPSRLVLPVVSGVDVPTGLPPCPGLRGEPCRTYAGG